MTPKELELDETPCYSYSLNDFAQFGLHTLYCNDDSLSIRSLRKKIYFSKKTKTKNKSYDEDESEIILSRLSAYMFKPRSMC